MSHGMSFQIWNTLLSLHVSLFWVSCFVTLFAGKSWIWNFEFVLFFPRVPVPLTSSHTSNAKKVAQTHTNTHYNNNTSTSKVMKQSWTISFLLMTLSLLGGIAAFDLDILPPSNFVSLHILPHSTTLWAIRRCSSPTRAIHSAVHYILYSSHCGSWIKQGIMTVQGHEQRPTSAILGRVNSPALNPAFHAHQHSFNHVSFLHPLFSFLRLINSINLSQPNHHINKIP